MMTMTCTGRTLGVLAIVIGLLLSMTVLSAAAQTTDTKAKTSAKTQTTTPAKAQVKQQEAASMDAGQRVFIDPKTKKLKEPEQQDIQALQSKAQPKTKQVQKRVVTAPKTMQVGSATGMQVSEDAMSYSVATRNADGTVTQQCVQGKSKAEKVVKSGAKKGATNDR